MADGYVDFNPGRASALPKRSRPRARQRREAAWLEPGEAFAILTAASEVDSSPGPRGVRFLHSLVGTLLLTGGRIGEVLGLTLRDVDLDGGWIHFRENRWRPLKTPNATRRVPLWPQLSQILTPFIQENHGKGEPDDLLFPSPNGGMLRDIRGSLQRALKLAGIEEKTVTPHTFRHTYTAQRVQTVTEARLPNGNRIWVPVSLLGVARELGHTDTGLVERLYGHLQLQPDRSTVVEYRETAVVPFPAEGRRGVG